ncbi:MAG: hypothetical protein K2N23_03675 [Clostridia bacterium]|nr:hypothetical protein [Clostridia bacterium]
MNLKKYIKLRDDFDANIPRTKKEELLFQQLLQKVKTEDSKKETEILKDDDTDSD